MPGELKRMIIKAKDDPSTAYTALVNPETYTINHTVQYNNCNTPPGSIGDEPQFVRMLPTNLQFDFLFDSTGVVPKPLAGIAGALENVPGVGAIAGALAGAKKYDILEEIKTFKDVVYTYKGNIHSPRKVILLWGTLLFEGVLTSLNFNFKLFQPDGTPIRVVATAAFRGYIENDLQQMLKNNSSPDLTHVRVVKKGDTLPLMAYRIYGDPAYYLEVAKVNNLTNFRDLKSGDKIFFPPIDKSKK